MAKKIKKMFSLSYPVWNYIKQRHDITGESYSEIACKAVRAEEKRLSIERLQAKQKDIEHLIY